MNIRGLTGLVSHLAPIAALRKAAGSSTVFGLLHAARPAVFAALVQDVPGPVVILTAHLQEAHDLAQELPVWTDRPVSIFPAVEALPYERVHLNREVLAAREAVARDVEAGVSQIVVAPVRAVLQPVQKPERSVGEMDIAIGETVQLDRLLERWTEAGYTATTMVDEPGTFARRGGVLDLFPAGAERPVRIELFGNDVESLRLFDPVTQRSVATIDHVTVAPMARLDEDARLSALDRLLDIKTEGMKAEARTRWMDDLARMEAGASLDELSVFAPYLISRPVSLLSCLPRNALVIVDGAQDVQSTAEELWQQAAELYESQVDAGELPAGLKAALLSPEELQAAMAGRRAVRFRAGTDAEEGVDLSGLFVPAAHYTGRVKSFVHDAAKGGQSMVVASLQHERVEELLREADIPVRREADLTGTPERGVTLLPFSVSEGWSLPGEHLSLITDYELFGRSRHRPVKRRPRAARESFFAGFQPGDYVVHLEHGIGRFEGTTRMMLDGAEREYALVQYHGTDRLYVPTDQLERLTRYVGVGDSPPPLNKLGGGEWQRARQRAKAAAEEIAKELIDLYAKRASRPGHPFSPDSPWQHELESSFPYVETADQLRTVDEIKADMEAPRPMDRLVCADVGYGKTEVAVRSAFKAVMDGRQVAVLVPTTILAQQHFETFSERFAPFPIKVEVISRFRGPKEQRAILQKLASGEVDVLIGTHRLLQKDVHFKNLGLLVIDEEQRFGVKHKERLKQLRESIDVLTLTATPIPRTLHMGLVGIREISVIETPPEGRLPIKTYLQPFDERTVRQAVLRELERDGQVYLVHNKVATIEAMAERIRRMVPEARVLVGHGQMDEAQLERVMLTFAHHEADVLICSTIIENGLDIPNVNTIIVNNAHTLGLTQLYQLRGRVGRSPNQAYAYLLYPKDVTLSHDAARRLEAVFEAQELGAGFSIAMKDLEIRGAGNLLGADQSGNATAIGFDLYTRMVSEAVERLRGMAVEEPPLVTLDLPLTAFLPVEYVGDEDTRLTLYRRLAGVQTAEELEGLHAEVRDRFGPLPSPVENLFVSVGLKLLAAGAHVSSVTLSPEALILRGQPNVVYDRVTLYKRYGMEAKISTNVLRIPRHLLGKDWVDHVREILQSMVALRRAMAAPEAVNA